MQTIKLTKGKYAILDDEDFETLSIYKWNFHNQGYAVRSLFKGSSKRHDVVLMHRQIMKTPSNKDTDHLNGNKLDNRKCNLVICDTKHNMRNRKGNSLSSSRYKGVSWQKQINRWRAYITVDNRFRHLGTFIREEDAANAYNIAAYKYFGLSARLNKC